MPEKPIDNLCRYGFYLSILLIFYGTLFPFQFDLSPDHLSQALSGADWRPYWDEARGRIPSLPDMMSNLLLTVPLGFFGFLCFDRRKNRWSLVKWPAIGLWLGVLVETVQLGIPLRSTAATDALNNGLGAFIGAGTAALFGQLILNLFSGSLLDREKTYFVLLLGVAIVLMLLPFDFSIDVSHMASSIRNFLRNPWESGIPMEDEWIQSAVFVLLGVSAGRARIRFALFIPFILEFMQLFIESHAPSLRDLAVNWGGVAGGMIAARFMPEIARPAAGLILMSIALAAQGLSPYHFGGRSHFEWIPLVEYYNRTTGAALYDAILGIVSYGLLPALWPKRAAIVWGITLACMIEVAQTFLPARCPGITDILTAGIGCWTGLMMGNAVRNVEAWKRNEPPVCFSIRTQAGRH